MFTGLVLGVGTIQHVASLGSESRLTIHPHFPLETLVKGESIAVNGTCLSVETFDNKGFTAYASQETMRLTTLGTLRVGSKVNLERALALGDRLGGHIVSGHVDGIATITGITKAGSSRIIRLSFPEHFARHIIPKGSITLDGVSLTVNACGTDFLEVNVIPETQSTTTVGDWETGRQLNFETDIIGKYVERMLHPYTPQGNAAPSGVTFDFLRDNGF